MRNGPGLASTAYPRPFYALRITHYALRITHSRYASRIAVLLPHPLPLQPRDLGADRLDVRLEGRLRLVAHREVLAIRRDRALDVARQRGQAALLAQVRREVRRAREDVL